MKDFLSKEAAVAAPGFNRWLVPPAAIAIHMCIGQVYAFSVFNKPLARDLGVDVGMVNISYQIALFVLGVSAALLGKWVERSGPRRTMLAACACFCGGLAVTALAVRFGSLPLVWLGYGLLGGVGLGLGYIALYPRKRNEKYLQGIEKFGENPPERLIGSRVPVPADLQGGRKGFAGRLQGG